ncbi:hypothetical protein BCR33DRAFT_735911 [Rhizoclosmatium globosum]|uniref:Uncharacterized protein n=1 Tax=Rhizoclosmatium globosum TaxID=329046 RepID=A0A1Y2CL65_9FUNG|nr:hypothetical protein BCR33DRAFT_735911 [Rhizoclosmatium globosum]|eukprot:ORY47740.1 hypothetical protein BCR33DRAFT_735911 [Rhizoclosmatium globosum]
MYVNGRYDPWHWLSILGKAPDPKTQQSILYDGATHCSDFRGRASATTATSFAVFDQIYATYDSWLVVPTPTETTGIVNVTVPTAEYKVPVGVIAGGSAAGAFVLGVVILVIFRQRRTSVPIASKALKLEDGKSDETPKKTAVVTDL